MKIYTRTGDKGMTALFSGFRVAKTSPRIEAHGSIDELNSVLGMARASAPQAAVDALLAVVQRQLFAAGADLATPMATASVIPRVGANDTNWLEGRIDEMSAELPPLRAFILPGGTPAAAQLQFARTIARRAERDTFRVIEEEEINEALPSFLNRLSDFLFTLARYENFLAGREEEPWIAGPSV